MPAAKAKAGKAKPKSYAIDTLIDAYRTSLTRLLAEYRSQISTPVQHAVLWYTSDGGFLPEDLLLYADTPPARRDECRHVIPILPPKTLVPFSTYALEDRRDPMVRTFHQTNGLMDVYDRENQYGWWDSPKDAPAALVSLGFARLLAELPDLLARAEIPLAPSFRAGWRKDGDEEIEYPNPPDLEAGIAQNMAGRFIAATTLTAFARLCYANTQAQRWLIGLGKAKKSKEKKPDRVGHSMPPPEETTTDLIYKLFGWDGPNDHNASRLIRFMEEWKCHKPVLYRGDLTGDSFTVPSQGVVLVTGDITLNQDLILERRSMLVINGTLRARHVLTTAAYLGGRQVHLRGICFGEENGTEDFGGNLMGRTITAQAFIDHNARFSSNKPLKGIQITTVPGRQEINDYEGTRCHYSAKRLTEILRPEVMVAGKLDAVQLRTRLLAGKPVLLKK